MIMNLCGKTQIYLKLFWDMDTGFLMIKTFKIGTGILEIGPISWEIRGLPIHLNSETYLRIYDKIAILRYGVFIIYF